MEEVELHDINHLPKQPGVLLFGISMSKIGNVQSAENCFELMNHFYEKIIEPSVGLHFVYADSLYLNSTEEARKVKWKYEPLMHAHKYAFFNLLKKHPKYIRKSFSFSTWSQMLLESKQFFHLFSELKKIYKEDEELRAVVAKDIQVNGEIQEHQVDFILEEILLFYLTSKGLVRIHNDFLQDKEVWKLWCYPGKPLLSEAYLYKNNLFKLTDQTNRYESSYYDLESKKLHNFNN